MEIDRKTLEDLRELGPRDAYEMVRRAVYQSPGGVSSEDFQAALEQLVHEGILSWEEIERFEDH
ncbi:MAG TPA: hypothetical protein VJV75_04585 [Candidatus Polarisedimenticolia bacterium]|nr:hypothetical protein [Candidatus Polarisedimenticolia bacterium]